ncbi:GNAT family N-acetyltransferase [Candidatus Gracilibacteria bacterium]|nr:GNAT family N-acetyltransferase [Candidatus Gracilibacteria bacterium]NJM88932.1 GNAT family N-acetyltransferase [Hydrococcus sp. RU_2_2]NJP20812.1 GNAT family N-acetyltransferase [Hydrococcus sp. CRU_1_1]NJQ96640.1 GNAT family N-acetyltransferase [Hydrococcus sp. CSU_1_8]
MARYSSILPNGCLLRQAKANDIWKIRKLVLIAKLDPTQLRWEQFWVIDRDGKIIACGQLRSFEGAQELGSLVVAKDWRNQGIGTYLAQHLIEIANQPLYLECLGAKLASFYTRLGFIRASWNELPSSIKKKFGISTFAASLLRLPLTIMQYRGVV